jgi:cytochrome b6-f complex iron-sulfur subunit
MNREEFLRKFGSAALLGCAGCGLLACGDEEIMAPTNVDITLDLTSNQYTALNNVGGSVSTNGIIIVRLSSTEFTALSRACTHQGTAVTYRTTQNDLHCSNHGSRFSTSGGVLEGPARRALTKYNTELTGNSLRVFS